ncbi:MAG: fumarate hydratase [Clostridia bacterium]|nr:fumarate hydratase [Clostridia bacterium]
MRELDVETIISAVRQMCIDSNCVLNDDIRGAIADAAKTEQSPIGKNVLESLLVNANIAKTKEMPICQDTGMMILFVEVGQELHITGGDLTEALNEGVRRGYKDGYLRKSVVQDPIRRGNTGDNTPAVIHYEIVPGDKLRITAMPKGFGSENMGGVKMLKPSQGVEGVIQFVLDTVKTAGPNPCPPTVVGIGIGGSMEKAAILSKKALARSIDSSNSDPYYADLERELLEKINGLGVGAAGLGGDTTSLGVNIETFSTHIAGLPVAVTISCHVTRHRHCEL